MSSSGFDKRIFKSDSNVLVVIRNTWPDFFCTLDNFKRPTFDFLMRFIIQLLTDLEIHNEDILKVGKKWQMNNIESISDITEIIVVYKPLDLLLKKINYTDFNFTDLIAPSNKTAMNMIKTVLNFILFRQNVYDDIESELYEIEKERSNFEDIVQNISNYQQMIEEFHSNETDYNQQLSKLKEMLDSLEAANKVTFEILNNLSEKIKIAELNKQKSQKQVNELQQQINKLKTEESKLTDQIVENSTQLQEKYDNISELKTELKEKQNQQKELLDSNHHLISICESIINKYKESQGDCKLLFMSSEKYIKSLKLSMETGKHEAEHNLQMQQMQEKISSTLALLETLEATGRQQLIINEEKKKRIENELIPFQLELENAKKNQKESKTNYDKISEDITVLNRAFTQYEKNYKLAYEFYVESYYNITKKVDTMDQYALDEFSKFLKN